MILILWTISFIYPHSALGNIRAPRIVAQHPMHELGGANQMLTVLREVLTISCDTVCTVEAKYEIESDSELDTILNFVAPVTQPVLVTGSNGAHIETRLSETVAPRQINYLGEEPRSTLYRAEFPFHFSQGVSSITVRYEHKPGKHEIGHGYLSDGEMAEDFRYEIWPLAEWELSSNFYIDLTIVFKRSERSLLQRLFANEDTPRCHLAYSQGESRTLYSHNERQAFEFHDTLTAPLADSLRCDFR